jgi:hypothetical protein
MKLRLSSHFFIFDRLYNRQVAVSHGSLPGLASGVYLAQVRAGEATAREKVVFLK